MKLAQHFFGDHGAAVGTMALPIGQASALPLLWLTQKTAGTGRFGAFAFVVHHANPFGTQHKRRTRTNQGLDGKRCLLHSPAMANYDSTPENDPYYYERVKAAQADPSLFEPNSIESEILRHARVGTPARLSEAGEVRAEFLSILLQGLREDWPVAATGVQIAGENITITGMLDLSGARAHHGGSLPPLMLRHCTFEDQINLTAAQLVSLDLSGCRNANIRASRIEILGHLILSRAECDRPVFVDAKIGGNVLAERATFKSTTNFTRASIGGNIDASRATFAGKVDFSNTVIGGSVDASHANLTRGFDLSATKVGGDVTLNEIRSYGRLNLAALHSGGALLAQNVRIWNRKYIALEMQNARFDGGVRLNRSRFSGHVDARGLLSGAHILARNTRFSCRDHPSLILMSASINGWIALEESVFLGPALFAEMTVTGQINAEGCKFRGRNGIGLVLDRTSAGDLLLENSHFCDPLFALNAKFTGIWAAAAKFRSHTKVSALGLSGAHIETEIDFSGYAKRDGTILPSAAVVGNLNLYDAHIRGSVNLDGVSFQAANGDDKCLSMQRTQIDGALTIRNLDGLCDGIFNLDGAVIDTLNDDPESGWPEAGLLDLDGLTYRAIKIPAKGGLGTELADKRVAWLKRQYKNGRPEQGEFRPQPFGHLAKVLRGQGHDYAAMKVSIEKRELQRKYADRGIARLIHTGLKVTSDYGYSPARALIWFVAWVTLGAIVAKLGLSAGIYEPANVDQPVISHLEPISYAFDLSTPIIDFGQASAYRLKPACSKILGMTFCGIRELLEVAYSTIGFILFSILVLTFSGVLSRERE